MELSDKLQIGSKDSSDNMGLIEIIFVFQYFKLSTYEGFFRIRGFTFGGLFGGFGERHFRVFRPSKIVFFARKDAEMQSFLGGEIVKMKEVMKSNPREG